MMSKFVLNFRRAKRRQCLERPAESRDCSARRETPQQQATPTKDKFCATPPHSAGPTTGKTPNDYYENKTINKRYFAESGRIGTKMSSPFSGESQLRLTRQRRRYHQRWLSVVHLRTQSKKLAWRECQMKNIPTFAFLPCAHCAHPSPKLPLRNGARSSAERRPALCNKQRIPIRENILLMEEN